MRKLFDDLTHAHRFAFHPSRAPRQAVRRTSFRLASSRATHRPCDLPMEKTRDASDRRLPPNRTACTRTSSVPGSLSPLSQRGTPAESKPPQAYRGTGRFTTSETASADRHSTRRSRAPSWMHERGRCLPTAPNAIEPLTPLSRAAVHPRASLTFVRAASTWPYVLRLRRIGTGRRMRQTAKTTVHAAS